MIKNRRATQLTFAAICAAAIAPSAANATLSVVPNHLASTEGNSQSSTLFQVGAASLQVYYSETFLSAAGIQAGSLITGVAFRRTGGGTPPLPLNDTTFASYNIFMSQSFATPGQMTTTFANNVVGTQTQVRTGSHTFLAGSIPAGGTPNAFTPVVDFDSGYLYNGGSILIEIRRGARSGDLTTFNTDTDNTATSQAGARWLFNLTSDSAVTGTISNSAQVFQLQHEAVPEPATLSLVALGAAAFMRRKKSKGN